MSSDAYDAIIIGAGISGLVCGCYLAKAGMKVLICEQHYKPGGYFTSFKRREFLFDAAAHSFGNFRFGGHVHNVLTELGVDKLVKIERFDPSDIIQTPDFKITIWNDHQKTISELSKKFPGEQDGIRKFFDFLILSNQSEFAKLKGKTFDILLRSFFTNERLYNSLAFPVFGNGGLPPSQMHAFVGSKIFREFIIDGGYYTDGGIQNLPNALENIFKQNHGLILYKTLVKKILVKNDTIKGIKTDNNQTFLSNYVISASDMKQTFKKLLSKKVISQSLLDRLKSLIPSISCFILYIGIDKPFKHLPPPGVNIWYLPNYDLDKIFNAIQNVDLTMIGFLLRVSPNEKTIVAYFPAPFKSPKFWRQNKERVSRELLNRVEKCIPDLKNRIVYFEAATPLTLQRYTLNYKGAAFGWAKLPSQTFEPMNKTSIVKGLYLTGHWTSMAFGLPGACYLGRDIALRIIRREKN